MSLILNFSIRPLHNGYYKSHTLELETLILCSTTNFLLSVKGTNFRNKVRQKNLPRGLMYVITLFEHISLMPNFNFGIPT